MTATTILSSNDKRNLVDVLVECSCEDTAFLTNRLYELVELSASGESVDALVKSSLEDTAFLVNRLTELVELNGAALYQTHIA
jgi:hypothetical protein